MELLSDKGTKNILSIYLNVSGDIMYMDDKAMTNLKNNKAKPDIFEIVDRDMLLKASMYERKIDFIKTRLDGYENGILAITGKGFSKRLELYLIDNESYKLIENNESRARRIFSLLSYGKDEINTVKIKKLLCKIAKLVGRDGIEMKVSGNDDIKETVDIHCARVLSFGGVSLLSEIAYEKALFAYADKTDYGTRICISARVIGAARAKGIYEFCNIYPTLSAIAVFLSVVCNNYGVELLLKQEGDTVSVSFTFPSGDIKEFPVLSSDNYIEKEIMRIFFD